MLRLILLFAMVWACIAQPIAQTAITNDAPPLAVEEPIGSNPAIFPTTKGDFWKWGIAVVAPMIVFAISKIPNIPRPVLPTITPLLGVALGVALNKLSSLQLDWVDMTQAGAAAVFIRETVNQWVTKQMDPLEGSKTDARPIDNAVAVAASTPAAQAELRETGKPSPPTSS